MTHSTTTAPAIEHFEPGYFRVTCPACGFQFRTSFRTTAEIDARAHVEYMLRKEQARVAVPAWPR